MIINPFFNTIDNVVIFSVKIHFIFFYPLKFIFWDKRIIKNLKNVLGNFHLSSFHPYIKIILYFKIYNYQQKWTKMKLMKKSKGFMTSWVIMFRYFQLIIEVGYKIR